ncbi:hypothetical protein EV378_4659 [Pseudonocardia endophytica]|uniref:HIRAN domain-containing protein n=1 Tax=Pseudonocardia endophytica TaxID=401976 RepID=A0A4R1HG77_PSEEN|nr:hypothetical protein EV378_4659 [Pseudonocardia endophytica]
MVVAPKPQLFEYSQNDYDSNPPRLSAIDVDPVDVSDDGRLGVVGESHYQQGLKLASGGHVAGYDLDSHLPAIALMVPEPSNPFDNSAVRIDVVHGGRSVTVGYLAREVARHYQPHLLPLRQQNRVARCPARITGGGSGKYYGIYLHVAAPSRLFAAAVTGPEASFASSTQDLIRLNADWFCTVTKEEAHQDVLARCADHCSDIEQPGEFVLDFCLAAKGKYRGERVIEVRIGPDRVGELTMAMTNRYSLLLDLIHQRGAVALAHGHIEQDDRRGYQVVLHMPRDPARPRRPEWFDA